LVKNDENSCEIIEIDSELSIGVANLSINVSEQFDKTTQTEAVNPYLLKSLLEQIKNLENKLVSECSKTDNLAAQLSTEIEKRQKLSNSKPDPSNQAVLNPTTSNSQISDLPNLEISTLQKQLSKEQEKTKKLKLKLKDQLAKLKEKQKNEFIRNRTSQGGK